MFSKFNEFLSKKEDCKNPLYFKLYEYIKELIESGELKKDTKLLSIRKMSENLKINQITIVSALNLLEKEGYIYKKLGSGTYVSKYYKKNKTEEYINYDDGSSIQSKLESSKECINFASASPTPDLFPVDEFKRVLNFVLDRDRGNAFDYTESLGYEPLRVAILNILLEKNIKTDSSRIQIISGAQQGLDIISKVLLDYGDYVMVECPTYKGAISVFKSRGVNVIDIDMMDGGPDINIIEYNIKKYKPKLFYTIPSFHNPTSYSWNNLKRIQLLQLSQKYNFYIIEEDNVSELDYNNLNLVNLKSNDNNDKVIFIKSFSKFFMPGIRLGFMVFPIELKMKLIRAKHLTDITSAGLIQRAFEIFILTGKYKEHSGYMYKIYKDRYFKVLENICKYFKNLNIHNPGGGLNFWITLEPQNDINTIFRKLFNNNILITPSIGFYLGKYQYTNSFRLSFASARDYEINAGIWKIHNIIYNK